MGVTDSNVLVDHINRDTRDNKKCNLRLATKSTNAMNTKIRKDNTSGIKGVTWSKKLLKWQIVRIDFIQFRLFV